MAVRQAGWGMLASSSVQEVHDFALISTAATLESRLPFIHFFDGFRTSHEIGKIEKLNDDDLRAMIDDDLVHDHRARGFHQSALSCAVLPRTRMSSSRAARPSTPTTRPARQLSRKRWITLPS